MEKALVRGWSTIKDDYLERNTTTRADLDDLDDLTALARYSNNGLASTVNYIPPSLNLPFAAGFPNPQLHTRGTPQGVPALGDWFAQRLSLSQ